MKNARAFTLIDTLIAMALLLLIGGSLLLATKRISEGGRTQEAGLAAAAMLKTAIESARDKIPPWFPDPGATVTLTEDQIETLLGQAPNVQYTDPSLYTVTAERTADGRKLTIKVCLSPAGNPYCLDGTLPIPSSQARYVPPSTTTPPTPPAPGNAQLAININAPSGAPVDVRVSGPTSATLKSAGLNTLAVAPGDYTVTANPTQGPLYSYQPNPTSAPVKTVAGRSYALSFQYACTTGAAAITVVLPPGVSAAPARTVVLDPLDLDVTSGGTFPYLTPGTYRLNARGLTAGSYTYTPSYAPQEFKVTPCSTAAATVSYQAITGALEVVVEKTGADAFTPNVQVSGPSYNATITRFDTVSLPNLTPGTYSATATDVLVDGVRHRATIAPGPVEVKAGETSQIRVTYAPISAKLTVNATAPSGLTPDLEITGPGVNQRQRTATLTLEDTPPGNYDVTAHPIQDGSYTYVASPSQKTLTLAAGDRKSASFTYQAATGAAKIILADLPDEAPLPTVTVGSTAITSNPAVLRYLAPGDYPVKAEPLVYRGYTYAPSPASGTLSVTAGTTTDYTITYAKLEGVITVEIQGLPSGAKGDATLSDDAGNTYPIQSTTTLTGMRTGTYQVTARDVTVDGITYAPTVTPASASLEDGQTLVFTVDYAPQGGNLEVAVAPSITADVLVQGPGGYARTLTGTTTLYNLPPGTYSITPRPVQHVESSPYAGVSYTYEANATSATVVAGRTTRTSVTYRRLEGTLQVDVRDVPTAGLTLTIQGPGGFTANPSLARGSNTFTYDRVPTGDFSISAPEWNSGTITYKPQPPTASATVTDGQTAAAALRYVAATGALQVNVSYPDGMPATQVELWQDSTKVASRTAGGGTSPDTLTFANLVPGTYTLTPVPVTDAQGFTYRAASTTVAVTAGATATANITYVKQSGTVRVRFSGVPTGSTPTLTLQGPKTYTFQRDGDYEIVAGSYNATASDLSSGGFTYDGAVTPSSFTLSPGSAQDVAVTYTIQAAYLTLSLQGLPSSASSRVTLSGPTNLSQTLSNGTHTLGPLLAGDYTLTIDPVYQAPYTYTPNPSSQQLSLAVGDRKSVSVSFSATTGALSITVNMPSGGPNPSVTVTGPSGYNRSITTAGTEQLNNLQPGSYTVTAQTVYDGSGFPYVPSPANQSVTVTAGNTASRTVTYSRQAGTLSLKITGLPSGAWASGRLQGPKNVSWSSPNGTKTYTLPPGSYTITANNYISGIYTYRPSISPGTVSISNGSSKSSTIAYSLVRGSLRVSVSGLPRKCPANITVTGPNGYRKVVYGTTTLTNLYPGTYTATPSARSCGGYTYYANARSATVRSGATATVSIAYSPTRLKAVIRTKYPSGSHWNTGNVPDITLSGPSTITLRPGTSYHPLVPNSWYSASPAVGYQKQIYAYCAWYGCTFRAYWVLTQRDNPPRNVQPGRTYTFTATWTAKKCQQEWLSWVCYVWDGSAWRRQ